VHTVVRFAIEDRRQFEVMAGNPEDLDAEIRAFLADLVRTELRLP